VRPHEWMIEPTRQSEWIEGKGLLVWLAFFFIELGAGTFFIASFFASVPAMIIGWLICAVLGGGLHLAYLGRPFRWWRMLLSSGWKTSWISRGLYFVMFFLLFGIIYFIQLPSTGITLLVITNVFAFLAVVYGGIALSYINGIPLWNSGLLPVLFGLAGLWGGAGITALTMLAMDIPADVNIETFAWVCLFSYALLVILYLMSASYRGAGGKLSVRELVAGKLAPIFWIIAAGIGMAVPMAVILYALFMGAASVPVTLLVGIIVFELVGDLSLRYCILRSGYYTPLLSSPLTRIDR
jgi:sulfite dehydrogenase (quinone) subunit SoeC